MTSLVYTPFTDAFQEAFELDTSVLQALLRKNQCSHGRTKYVQRLQVALRNIPNENVWAHYQALASDLMERQQQTIKKRKREKVFWDLKTNDANETILIKKQWQERFDALWTMLQQILDAVERLEYAAEAIWIEIARGFFLSLQTVSVAAVARVRVLLLRMALTIAYDLPKLQALMQDVFGKNDDTISSRYNTQDFLNKLLSKSEPVPEKRASRSERTKLTLKSLGMSPLPVAAHNGRSDGFPTHAETTSKASLESSVELNSDCMSNLMKCNLTNAQDVDLGEVAGTSSSFDVAQSTKATQKIKYNEMDTNATLVCQVKAKRRKTKRDKVKKPTTKRDFFDDLFG
jgi:hypothetical protein